MTNPPIRTRPASLPPLLYLLCCCACAIPTDAPPEEPPRSWTGDPVTIASFDQTGAPAGLQSVPKILRNPSAWREALSPSQFAVLRRGQTEIAYSGSLHANAQPGLYRCAACNTVVFSSAHKYDSETGWPSFYQPAAPENVYTDWDDSWGVRRRAVLCSLCDGRLGHVFKDGPPPTYLRYCINSAALRFQQLPFIPPKK